jgi:hypothetical protein
MRLRTRWQVLLVWSSSVVPAGSSGSSGERRPGHARRVRRGVRMCGLIGMMGLAWLVRGRPGRLVLSGTVLTICGVLMRHSPGGMILLPGLLCLLAAPLLPAAAGTDQLRATELERELAEYSTHAQREDLGATLDRYPDDLTAELREILAGHAVAADRAGIRGDRRVLPSAR